eukprot:2248017-Pyramimonas_sp.AAC.1
MSMSHAMGKSMMQVNADHSPHGPCFLRAPTRKLIWARLRDRDAYVEELDLDWDFSDPETI